MKKISLIVLTVTLVLSLFSCGGKAPGDDEIATTVKQLVAASAPLNEIYFGEGLPVDIFRAAVGNYQYISTDCEYKSINQIKEATQKVFSAEYCELLYETTFSGINEEGVGILYARYAEKNNELIKNSTIQPMMTGERTYNFDTMKILKKNSTTVLVNIDTTDDSGNTLPIQVRLVNENGVWLLDSPTY